MSKKQQKPHLIAALQKCKAMGHIRRQSIPDITTLYEYDCMLTCEEYQNQQGQKTEISYLHFTHKKKPHSFKINIPDSSYCSNAYHEMHWQIYLDKQMEVMLGDRIDISMAVNCLNYLNPEIESTAKAKLLESKEELKEEVKFEKKAKKQVLDIDDFNEGGQQKRSNFGSDQDSLGGKQTEPPPKVHVNHHPSSHRDIKDYGTRDHRTLLDYSESTKILITCKLIEFFRNKDNRMKKIPQIREYLRVQRFNVPDKPLKEMIGQLCISPIMDRTRGYLLKEIYLNQDQRIGRREEEQRMRAQKIGKQKQKRKRGKKQSKKNGTYKNSMIGEEDDAMEETLSPFEQLQRKMTKRRNSSKKIAAKQFT